MDEIAIKRHSFELAKNRLKAFSEKTEAELEIDKVRTDGGFLGLGDHRVTGYELNRRLETIQGHFIAVNTTNNKVIKEFREVYNALDVLDKDYMASIIANVKAIEKTSNDVRVQQGTLEKHHEKLAEQQSKLDTHQTEIEKNVANISKIVTALRGFKEKLEGYDHLKDIDRIWNDINGVKNGIKGIEEKLKKINANILDMKDHMNEIELFISSLNNFIHLHDIDNMWEDIDILKKEIGKINVDIQMHQDNLDSLLVVHNENKESIIILFEKMEAAEEYAKNSRNSIIELESFKTKVSTIDHLMEVDDIWKNTEENKLSIKTLEHTDKVQAEKLDELVQEDSKILQRVVLNEEDIEGLKRYKEKLSDISHLLDVDNIWKSVEEHTSQLIEGERKDEELASTIQKNKDEVETKIIDVEQTSNAAVELLTKRLKYAYWISGGAIGLAIIELILLLVKVM